MPAMKKWTLLAVGVVGMASGIMFWLSTPEQYGDDPFENLLAVTTVPNFARHKVPGSVTKYIKSPAFDIMTDVNWGVDSVSLETDLPIEPVISGGFNDDLTVRCTQVSFAVADQYGSLPGPVGWPPDQLIALARENIAMAPYMRRCQIQVEPMHAEPSEFAALAQRCQDTIVARFPGPVETKERNGGAFEVTSIQPVETPSGTLVEAKCWHSSARTWLRFEAWFLTI